MNDSINAPDSDYFTKWRLSPTNDYVMTSDRTLYWLNLSYPYSNNEVLRFIDCLKNNVDTTEFKGRIICLFGSDCKKQKRALTTPIRNALRDTAHSQTGTAFKNKLKNEIWKE